MAAFLNGCLSFSPTVDEDAAADDDDDARARDADKACDEDEEAPDGRRESTLTRPNAATRASAAPDTLSKSARARCPLREKRAVFLTHQLSLGRRLWTQRVFIRFVLSRLARSDAAPNAYALIYELHLVEPKMLLYTLPKVQTQDAATFSRGKTHD